MNEKGYVRKKRSDTDQRVRLIYLTEKGENMEEVIQEIDQAAIEKMLEGFEDEETERLLSYLDRLFQNLRE